MIKSRSFIDDDDTHVEQDLTVKLSVNMKTSAS
jgi:hypothetical protein